MEEEIANPTNKRMKKRIIEEEVYKEDDKSIKG